MSTILVESCLILWNPLKYYKILHFLTHQLSGRSKRLSRKCQLPLPWAPSSRHVLGGALYGGRSYGLGWRVILSSALSFLAFLCVVGIVTLLSSMGFSSCLRCFPFATHHVWKGLNMFAKYQSLFHSRIALFFFFFFNANPGWRVTVQHVLQLPPRTHYLRQPSGQYYSRGGRGWIHVGSKITLCDTILFCSSALKVK